MAEALQYCLQGWALVYGAGALCMVATLHRELTQTPGMLEVMGVPNEPGVVPVLLLLVGLFWPILLVAMACQRR